MAKYRLPDELDKVTPQLAREAQKVVEEELAALETVITAADQGRRGEFINNAYQRRLGYEELYRHGFGKTVVIDTEFEGRLTFRISQASCDYANTSLGFSTPNAPVGNLCRTAKLGQTAESAKWGEYTIIEIRHLARFTGREAAEQIRNFRVMEADVLPVAKGKEHFQPVVFNLRASLKQWPAAMARQANRQTERPQAQKISASKTPEKNSVLKSAPVQLTPAKPEPLKAAAVQPAPAKPEPLKATAVQPAPAKPEPLKAAAVQPAPAKPEPLKAAAVQPTPAKPEPLKAAAVPPEPLKPEPLTPAPVELEPLIAAALNPEPVNVEMLSPEFSFTSSVMLNHPVIDLDFDDQMLLDEEDIEPEGDFDIFGRSESEQDDYYGLSNFFFLNPTDEQLEVMTNNVHAGPMLVEGVAGSGKTCAALGRAKTLCDLARDPDPERYNSDFLADSSVGFVRTGELVQYLRASCLELGIEQLPIEEYAALAYQLCHARNIEQNKTGARSSSDEEGKPPVKPGAKYQTLASAPEYDSHRETSMSWLQQVAKLIGERLGRELQHLLDALNIPERLIQAQVAPHLTPANAGALLDKVKLRLAAYYEPLMRQLSGQTSDAFVLDDLISRILKAHEQLEAELFDPNALWVNPAQGKWQKVSGNQAAVAQLRQAGAVFVVLDYDKEQKNKVMHHVMVETLDDLRNLFKQNAKIVNAAGEQYESLDVEQIWALRPENTEQTGKKEGLFSNLQFWRQKKEDAVTLYCQLDGVKPLEIKWAYDFDDLNIHLLNNKLIALLNGRNAQRILETNPYCRKIELAAEVAQSDDAIRKDKKPSSSSLAAEFKKQLRRIFNKCQYADLYRDALLHAFADKSGHSIGLFADWPEAHQVLARLKNHQLADHDKDLLLALAHIMTRGVGHEARVQGHMLEQPYYRSVFIDEVQDFTEQQIFLMAEQADPKYHAVTLVGDMHQQLGRGNVQNIEACFPYRPLTRYLLKENKRQERQPQLAASAMLFRAMVQEDTRLHDRGLMDRWREQASSGKDKLFYDREFEALDEQILDIIGEQPHGRTVAVICPTQSLATELETRLRNPLVERTSRRSHVAERIDLAKKYMVHFSCPEHVKGLEFDTVIYAGMEHIDWNDAHQLNKTYVTLSRPRKQLVMFGDKSRLPSAVSCCLLSETRMGIN